MATHEDLVGAVQRQQLLARAADELPGSTKQGESLFNALHRQGGDEIFFGREVLINGSLGILGRVGESVHSQRGEALLDEHLARNLQEHALALFDFPFFPRSGSHARNIDDPS
jgi:hypothetical protein